MGTTMRITVMLTPEEYAKIKRLAGLIPLSAYIRSIVIPQLPSGKVRDKK
jgi:hypothetical protein